MFFARLGAFVRVELQRQHLVHAVLGGTVQLVAQPRRAHHAQLRECFVQEMQRSRRHVFVHLEIIVQGVVRQRSVWHVQ